VVHLEGEIARFMIIYRFMGCGQWFGYMDGWMDGWLRTWKEHYWKTSDEEV
jgi:hypothetical protein